MTRPAATVDTTPATISNTLTIFYRCDLAAEIDGSTLRGWVRPALRGGRGDGPHSGQLEGVSFLTWSTEV
jgi:hypothetical protein